MPTLTQIDKNSDPLKLSGLRQAIYVLKCLADGQAEPEIIDKFEGDDKILRVWLDFLVQGSCAEKLSGKWVVTNVGEMLLEKYSH